MSLPIILLSMFTYICTDTAPMKEEPRLSSELVSETYHSEEVSVLEHSRDWVKIKTLIDSYEGWTSASSVCDSKTSFDQIDTIAKVTRCTAHLYHTDDTIYGPIITLPFESRLKIAETPESSTSRWIKVSLIDGREGFIQRGDVSLTNLPINRKQMCELSMQFLGLPYTWGGRSSFGYDCSGFTQMLYRQMGIFLPRDSKDQIAWEGFVSIEREKLNAGDLVFFGLAEDKIRHVGLYLGNDEFIHSTVAENMPYIRISKLSDPEWNGARRFEFSAFRTLRPKIAL